MSPESIRLTPPQSWLLPSLALLLLTLAPRTTAETTVPETSPGLDSIIAQCHTALGGAERWRSVDSLTLRGRYSTFSAYAPFVMERQRPNLYRFEHVQAGFPLTIGFDGKAAWWENHTPFSEAPWPSRPPVFYALGYEADADFDYPFLDADTKGHIVELVGIADLEGIEAHELRVTLANGTVESWYIDVDTSLPAGRKAQAGFKDITVELRVFFSDFREVEGLQIPHTVESELGNLFSVMEVDAVEVDREIPVARFQLPLSPAQELLGQLEGEWSVTVETRFMPMAPWVPGETKSTIRAGFDGRVFEERLDFLFAGHPRSIQRLYTYDRFADQVRIVQIDDLTAHPNVMQGTFEGQTLLASNLETGTPWEVRGVQHHDRLHLELEDANSFRVTVERSMDGGSTWLPFSRFHYQRTADKK